MQRLGWDGAGWVEPQEDGELVTYEDALAAVVAERERCARICEDLAQAKADGGVPAGWQIFELRAAAAAIRQQTRHDASSKDPEPSGEATGKSVRRK